MMTSDEDMEELQNALGDLRKRIDRRARELAATGRFPEAHQALLRDIEARERALRDRVDAACRTGSAKVAARSELRRDYASLFDNVLRLEQGIDADFDARGAIGRDSTVH